MTTRIKDKFQFADLNIRHDGSAKNTALLVARALRMGYDSVAINIDVGDPFTDRIQESLESDEPIPKKKRKMMKRAENEAQLDIFPMPYKVPESALNPVDLKRLEAEGKVFRQFSRVTLTVTDSTSIYKMITHPKIKLFDIVAIRITDQETLSTLSRKGETVDIITFDACSSSKQSWMFAPKLIQAVAAEGIGFELTYGEALIDTASRLNFIQNARQLIQVTRQGRNVFLSSGASELIQLRGPYDVANMACLMDLTSFKGIHLISNTPKNILLRSQARKQTIKGTINIADLELVPHRTKSPTAALDALLKIDEFKAQAMKKDDGDMKMETN